MTSTLILQRGVLTPGMSSFYESEAQFRAQVDSTLADVCSITAYVDTIQIRVRRKLSPNDFNLLNSVNFPGQVIANPSRLKGWYILRIQRPSRGTLNFLATVAPGHVVNRVDVAIDFITQTSEAANTVGDFLNLHLRQLWHGKRRQNAFDKTIYYDTKKWNARNIVIYSNRLSKIGKAPCAHVEFRFTGARTCKRYKLDDVQAVTNADFVSIIQKNFCLAALMQTRMDRRIETAAASLLRRYPPNGKFRRLSTVEQWDRWLRLRIARSLGAEIEEFPIVPVQRWLETSLISAKGALYELPASTLINRHNCIQSW